MKIVSEKISKEMREYKNITDLLKKNKLVGVLTIYKYTGKETKEKYRIRSPEEILYNWTGGETLDDVINDLSNSKEGQVVYTNCYEYWKGKGENFTKYKCKFYVINRSKIKRICSNGKCNITYNNEKIAEDNDVEIDTLYINIKTTEQEEKIRKEPTQKDLNEKLKEKGLAGYVLYGNDCKEKFEKEFKNNKINEGIYKKDDCILVVFKPEDNNKSKNIYVKDVSNIVKSVVKFDNTYYLVVDKKEFHEVECKPKFLDKGTYVAPERADPKKLYGWLGLSNGDYDAPKGGVGLNDKKDMKEMLKNANVTKGEEFWRGIEKITILTSYLIKYDGNLGLHIESKSTYKYKSSLSRWIDKILSFFGFGVSSKNTKIRNHSEEQVDNNVKQTTDKTNDVNDLLKKYKNNEITTDQVIKNLSNIYGVELNKDEKKAIITIFDMYKADEIKDIDRISKTIDKAMNDKKDGKDMKKH